jgi:hypothetical protein
MTTNADNAESLNRLLAEARIENASLREQLARRQRCWDTRRQRFLRRNEALAAFLAGRPSSSWKVIHKDFRVVHPDLVLTASPPGPLDSLSLEWVRHHTISAHALATGYRRFLRNGDLLIPGWCAPMHPCAGILPFSGDLGCAAVPSVR